MSDFLMNQQIVQCNCVEGMKRLPSGVIPLTLTCPPYESIRTYDGHAEWDFLSVAQELYRITTPGGVVVWVVQEQIIDGSESGESSRQRLAFANIGFRLHYTMVMARTSGYQFAHKRYGRPLEYAFILSKGPPRYFCPIRDKRNKWGGQVRNKANRNPDGNFDNIEQPLLDALLDTARVAHRGDFCVGYFNLRGWRQLDEAIERWAGGDGQCCRLLVGMHRLPQKDVQTLFRVDGRDDGIDNATAIRIKKELIEDFRNQLTWGAPSNEDEAGLRRLAAQIKARKVVVKLFLAYPLHAKLYLLFRPETVNPAVGFVGSSNLTLSGLSHQGELNVDVLDHDACAKLARWFMDRWDDQWCLDISADLVRIIDESWARPETPPPYHIYIKMAYHLAQEALTGISEFRIPRDFGDKLFEFQVKAVQIAAHHLNKRGGVLIGDVVGLGKTLMATALARIFEDDHDLETLILCPRNLVAIWEDYRTRYRLRGQVLSVTQARKQLPELRRYRLVLIDESHNFRNREGKT
jgi:hypothetical protein